MLTFSCHEKISGNINDLIPGRIPSTSPETGYPGKTRFAIENAIQLRGLLSDQPSTFFRIQRFQAT